MHDRYLAIWKEEDFHSKLKRFDFYGTSNVHFFHNPIYIGIRYKNILFLNISHAALFSIESDALKLIDNRIDVDLNNPKLEFEVNRLPKTFNLNSLKFRKMIPENQLR